MRRRKRDEGRETRNERREKAEEKGKRYVEIEP